MLQIKTWSWNVNLPKGKNANDIQKDINLFLRNNTCIVESFNIFEMTNGIMFAHVLYRMRKK